MNLKIMFHVFIHACAEDEQERLGGAQALQHIVRQAADRLPQATSAALLPLLLRARYDPSAPVATAAADTWAELGGATAATLRMHGARFRLCSAVIMHYRIMYTTNFPLCVLKYPARFVGTEIRKLDLNIQSFLYLWVPRCRGQSCTLGMKHSSDLTVIGMCCAGAEALKPIVQTLGGDGPSARRQAAAAAAGGIAGDAGTGLPPDLVRALH